MTGNNTYTGLTTINAGTLQLGNGGTPEALLDLEIAELNNGILGPSIGSNRSRLWGGISISGPGRAVHRRGHWTTRRTLSGNNTYSGATLVSAGTLQAGSATAFSPNSAFTVNGQLDLNGFSNTIGSLAGNGIVTNNGGTLATLAIGNDNTNTTFGGSLQDGMSALGLTKVGTGTLTLTGDGYSGYKHQLWNAPAR